MFVHSGFFHITFNVLIQASSAIYYYKSNKQLYVFPAFFHSLILPKIMISNNI